MKKIFYSLIVLSLFTCGSFSQTAGKTDRAIAELQQLQAKREKFDPKRDPNLDLQTAVAKAQKENKRIILDIGGEWCSWCRAMDFFFMRNSGLTELRDKNFIWVKINMSDENENKEFLSKYPEIQDYPHLFVLEKDGTLLQSQSTDVLEKKFPPLVVPSDVKNKEEYRKAESQKRMLSSYELSRFTEFLNKWSSTKN